MPLRLLSPLKAPDSIETRLLDLKLRDWRFVRLEKTFFLNSQSPLDSKLRPVKYPDIDSNS